MSGKPTDAGPIYAGCVLGRAQPVVLETLLTKKLIWCLLLSSLWGLRSSWFTHNICLSGLAVSYSSRPAAQNTPAACHHQLSPEIRRLAICPLPVAVGLLLMPVLLSPAARWLMYSYATQDQLIMYLLSCWQSTLWQCQSRHLSGTPLN